MWMHNGLLELTGEKMSKSLGNIVSLRDAVEQWGREAVLLFFMNGAWRKPIDFSDEVMVQARARGRHLPQLLRRSRVRAGRDRARRARPCARRRFQHARGPRALPRLADSRSNRLVAVGLELFGLGDLAQAVSAPKASSHSRRSARSKGKRRFRRGGPAARRDRGPGLGGQRCRRRFRARAEMTREQIYGRRPVREALRGPREVLELWVTERALKAEPWLREPGPRDRSQSQARAGLDRSGGDARPPGSPGLGRALPLRGRVRARRRRVARCSSASTRSPTRTTSARSPARERLPGRPESSSRRTMRPA